MCLQVGNNLVGGVLPSATASLENKCISDHVAPVLRCPGGTGATLSIVLVQKQRKQREARQDEIL